VLTTPIPDDQLDRVFHALSNRARRAMLARLAAGPAIVKELAAPLDMSLPAVSKHLRVLEEAALIAREIDGRVHHCSLGVAALQDVERWLDNYRSFWTGTLESLARYVEEADDERG